MGEVEVYSPLGQRRNFSPTHHFEITLTLTPSQAKAYRKPSGEWGANAFHMQRLALADFSGADFDESVFRARLGQQMPSAPLEIRTSLVTLKSSDETPGGFHATGGTLSGTQLWYVVARRRHA